jgi:transcriptional regulator with XRE-family HTH domain
MSRFSRNAGSRPRTRLDATRPSSHPALVTTPTSRGDLGDEIRRRRKQRNLTQTDLAKLANVATTNVGKIERGAPVSTTTLRAVARALQLPAELVGPFLDETASSESRGLSDEERAMIRSLTHRGWPAADIAEAVDVLRRSKAGLPTVEQPTDTERERKETTYRRTGEAGAR